MLLLKTFLRLKYSLNFFTTTLLISLTTQSSLAFNITPPRHGPTGERYTLENQTKGFARRNPTDLISITRGGTIGFLETLRREFPTWTFNSAPNDLAGRFDVYMYSGLATIGYSNDYQKVELVGGNLELNYIPGIGDPEPTSSSLRWIQRVLYSNYTITWDGSYEDFIDVGSEAIDPFYDLLGSTPPFFESFASRSDLNKNHTWLAELYLVNQTAPNQVTIYNGVQWGWESRVESVPDQSVPEPLTILGAATALGYGGILKRQYFKKKKS